MFRPREHSDKTAEHQLKAALRVLWRKIRHRRLFSYNKLQFRNQIHYELCVRLQRLAKGVALSLMIRFALTEKRADKAVKGLSKSGVRNVALILVELAGCKKPAGRNEHFVELVDDRGLADSGITRHQHQLRFTGGDDLIEGIQKRFDLSIAAVQFFRHEEPV